MRSRARKVRDHLALFLCGLIVVAYLALGTAYALLTPRWQVPDEPAHYNYIRTLAKTGHLPVLQMGDYPHDYLEAIKAARFPDSMPIDGIRYESHQPPLYYLLSVPLYKIVSGWPLNQQVVALRLFSVLLGGVLLIVVFRLVTEIFGDEPLVPLAATGFVATVPSHIAMTAAVNNDALAELILALILWLAVRRLKGSLSARRYAILGGLLLGLGLLTKTTTYLVAPSVLTGAEFGRWVLGRGGQTEDNPDSITLWISLRVLSVIGGLAIVLSLWWFWRNVATYGRWDLFGWQRHDAIVVGQPGTADWIAQYGTAYVVRKALTTTFKSFWAVFGWMGALVDERIYLLLAVLSAVAALGLVLFVIRVIRQPLALSGFQRGALALLALGLVLTTGSFVWYNLKFVQHQGRYLYPALGSIGVFFTLGLRELMACEYRGLLFGLLFLGLLELDIVSLVGFIVPTLR